MFSIYILTYNEEIDIAACIESALLSDDVVVIDSYSCDRTVDIANRYPVRVIQHAFESHGKQRTWMLESVPAKYPWVYILEADERMTRVHQLTEDLYRQLLGNPASRACAAGIADEFHHL